MRTDETYIHYRHHYDTITTVGTTRPVFPFFSSTRGDGIKYDQFIGGPSYAHNPLIKASAQLGNTRTHVFVRIRVTSIPRPLKCRPTGSVAEKLAITMGVILRSDRKSTCT